LLVVLFLVEPPAAHAYIGPGAGFAFVGSFFVLFAAFFLAFLKLLTSPVRSTFRWLKSRKAMRKAKVKKVIVLGLDGQDPVLTDQFLEEGILPNFAKLREQGSYVRLETSFPAESPVAWSSFQTGCNPGKHKVFDFLVPNRKSHLPELCSAKVTASGRTLNLGKYKIPLGKPTIDLGRKSRPFWNILGDHGITSNVIRVPITFPPEKLKHGTLLSAMCVPDLKGSQGTFSYYSDEPKSEGEFTGGQRIPVTVDGGAIKTYVSGPENSMVEGAEELRIPFEVQLGKNGGPATLIIDKKKHELPLREFTPWIELNFKPGLGVKVRGIVRFYLLETEPHFRLYMTPINVDPDKPALPISHPFTYAIYLSKTQGRYSTLGLAEDTWALNERVLDEEGFLKQTYLIHEERERQFFDALEKVKRGAVVCVFDITDRLQHMFFRYLSDDHPANADKDTVVHKDAIRDLYKNMDDLVGRVMKKVKGDTQLFVMSDHGFKPFKRGVNLNTWLWQNGYMKLKGDNKPTGTAWYQDVDWSQTQAYAVGLGGIYINVKGREAFGIVEAGAEQQRIKDEIIQKLATLRDPANDASAIGGVYDTKVIYSGPYVKEAPDIFTGFAVGYRASWDCATGKISEEVIDDNTKSWSGDHCMNPPDVPGIFFSNKKLDVETVNIMDIGPTVLDLFGVPVPRQCDGKPFAVGGVGPSQPVAAEDEPKVEDEQQREEPVPAVGRSARETTS
jgi:predicted AlkP superfamily phosphohydrolase/phosphomutase